MRPSVYSARYDTVAITLHWAIAALIVLDFLLAMSFSQFNPGDTLYFRDAYPLHMSCGALILALSVARLLWRLAHRRPPLPDMPWLLRALARASHFLLYVFMIAAPASGWLVLSLRHQRTSVFGLFSWAWPTVPAVASMPFAQRQPWHDVLLPLEETSACPPLAGSLRHDSFQTFADHFRKQAEHARTMAAILHYVAAQSQLSIIQM